MLAEVNAGESSPGGLRSRTVYHSQDAELQSFEVVPGASSERESERADSVGALLGL
jgi:hypothetical protein